MGKKEFIQRFTKKYLLAITGITITVLSIFSFFQAFKPVENISTGDRTTQNTESVNEREITKPEKDVSVVKETDIENPQKETIVKNSTATITVGEINYMVRFDHEQTAYSLMEKATEQGLTIETEDYGSMGKLITSLNGTKNNHETAQYWIFYLNGQKSALGASSVEISDQDVLEWKYEERI